MTRVSPWIWRLAFVAWLAVWFWAFSFAFSGSFFQYHLATRLPFFFLALFAVAVPPLSSYWILSPNIRKKWSATKAGLIHFGISATPLLLFWAIYSFWVLASRVVGGIAFEADEAMGIGIYFGLCVGVFTATNLVTWLVLFGLKLFGRRDRRA